VIHTEEIFAFPSIFANKIQRPLDTKFERQYIPYWQTGKFTKIVLDYISQSPELRDFYEHPVNLDGIRSAIGARKKYHTNRRLLAEQFSLQYQGFENCETIRTNINALPDENTFTVCTAHQPNIFTGHLYFVYKILHTIKLAATLKEQLPEYHFVPVFFMGSEDADLAELNHIVLDGTKYEWETSQTGAVGRMKVDRKLIQLIDALSGRLSVEKYGSDLVALLRSCYVENRTIEEATFLLVHHLFRESGLLILLPDNAEFKRTMLSVFEDDIFHHRSSQVVNGTSEKLAQHYKAQAYPREINLFYLKDQIRNRVIPVGDHFVVHDTDIVFTKDEIRKELAEHPRRFSPNVILRGLFQEMILPDVAWIGGGGELAYWLQLKDLFRNYSVPYPVLVVRNSFMVIDAKTGMLLRKLDIQATDLFRGRKILLDEIVKKESTSRLNVDEEKGRFERIYEEIRARIKDIDPSLADHVAALETRQRKSMDSLEKKMLRAEKRKFSDRRNQLDKIFSMLFPDDGLQERTENFGLFYSRWGKDFFDALHDSSLALEQEFCIIGQEEQSAKH
jgi:bacillithiol biosynthesis cysteine-adding enzyme BshC